MTRYKRELWKEIVKINRDIELFVDRYGDLPDWVFEQTSESKLEVYKELARVSHTSPAAVEFTGRRGTQYPRSH